MENERYFILIVSQNGAQGASLVHRWWLSHLQVEKSLTCSWCVWVSCNHMFLSYLIRSRRTAYLTFHERHSWVEGTSRDQAGNIYTDHSFPRILDYCHNSCSPWELIFHYRHIDVVSQHMSMTLWGRPHKLAPVPIKRTTCALLFWRKPGRATRM